MVRVKVTDRSERTKRRYLREDAPQEEEVRHIGLESSDAQVDLANVPRDVYESYKLGDEFELELKPVKK